MDQYVDFRSADRTRAVERLCDFIIASIDRARAVEAPFYHLELERIFPDEVYSSMLTAMPVASTIGRCVAKTTATCCRTALIPASSSTFSPNTFATCRRRNGRFGTSSAARYARNP